MYLKIIRFLLAFLQESLPVILSRMLVVTFALLPSLGCSPNSSSMHNESFPLPTDLQIVFGEGGGFSGLWSGYSIHADDTVYEWKGRSFGENPVYAGTLLHDSLEALWHGVLELRLLEHQSSVIRANYVHALAVSADGSEHMFAWEPSMSTDSTAAPPIAFRARCLNAIRRSLHP
jgi:hypothetical protein